MLWAGQGWGVGVGRGRKFVLLAYVGQAFSGMLLKIFFCIVIPMCWRSDAVFHEHLGLIIGTWAEPAKQFALYCHVSTNSS